MKICINIPVYTKSEANSSEHWTRKRSRSTNQKMWTRYAFARDCSVDKVPMPCHIKMTRHAPRTLDSDNLPVSMKHIRDQIADLLIPGLAPGRADGSDQFTWEYAQQKSAMYSVKIEITPRENND